MHRLWFSTVLFGFFVLRVVANNNRCANQPDGVFINDFTSCAAFFTCFRGQAIAGECPPNFVFNEEAQLCDHPWNVKCLICPESDSFIPSFEPIEGECSFYAICIQGVGELRECADDLQFNVDTGLCDTKENVNCEEPTCPNNVDPSRPVNVPHESDCSKYYVCVQGIATERECAPTLLFNPETRFCDLEENVECQVGVPSPTTCPPTGIHYIGNPLDCESFFVCFNGQQSPEPTRCAPGLIFDIIDSVCRMPSAETRCADGSEPPGISTLPPTPPLPPNTDPILPPA